MKVKTSLQTEAEDKQGTLGKNEWHNPGKISAGCPVPPHPDAMVVNNMPETELQSFCVGVLKCHAPFLHRKNDRLKVWNKHIYDS